MRKSIILSFGAVMLAAVWGTVAVAQTRSQVYGSDLTQQTQTAYLQADAGMTTFESAAAGSKETQGTATYTIGGWAGEDRLLGATVTSSESVVPFSLNNSELRSAFRDVRLKMRLGWLTPSVGASLSDIDVEKDGVQTIGVYGTGANAGLALTVPVYMRLVAEVEGFVVESSKVYDKLNGDAKLGRRNEADGHLSFDLTDRIVDLLVGYRMRSYELESGDETFKEQSQGAYAGLRLGAYF
jgi:hypothetical protein